MPEPYHRSGTYRSGAAQGTTPDAIVPVLVLDLDEAEGDTLRVTLDPLAAMAQSDASRIRALLATVRTDNESVQALLRRTAGEQLWSLLHPQADLDLTGSGNETAAHLLENGRITIVFCSFDKTAGVMRLYGRGRAIHPRDGKWNEYRARFSSQQCDA